MNDEIQNAAEELANWLADPHELGHRPSKVQFVEGFEDEDGIQCLVFKFKKSLLSPWYLGIVSESGTFSEMQPFDPATQRQDAQAILTMLKNYWKERAKNL